MAMEVLAVATLTVRGLDDDLHARLRVRAAHNGRSMEAEVREILREQLTNPVEPGGLGSRIHARAAAVGGFELELPPRNEYARPVEFGG
ncbi:FitA-like ribbon-helix-helix domain-containing protein [Nocardia australiensis]|uniref:FitA-like ribbon-helix-helix domain-containing protein n=1 Tax=Nocardia australiensis TaxID=2887191 RepID=UPI001D15C855|nr:plasmid stabilization protein [Nocardia australiensis]